ncbi:MAG: hypothetical protein WCA35_14440 [Kovacikia sp.]
MKSPGYPEVGMGDFSKISPYYLHYASFIAESLHFSQPYFTGSNLFAKIDLSENILFHFNRFTGNVPMFEPSLSNHPKILYRPLSIVAE